MRTAIVAEVGMNHLGYPLSANKYMEALASVRPDAVTFQIREPEYYQKQQPGESTLLPEGYYELAAMQARSAGMQFGIALCDATKVPYFERIRTDFYKVLSKDIGNVELVRALLATGKTVYVSTGMSDEDEIAAFLAGLGSSVPPNLSLIHTQLSYNDADTNLRAIGRLQKRFSVPVAFGLHSPDVHALYAALGFSPSALFFYVKGDRKVKHKDEEHAVRLTECAAVVAEIRRLERMLGDGVKKKMGNTIPDQKK